VKPEAAETFWQRFWATYKFRRNFGREGWWHSFGGRSGQLGAIELRKNREGTLQGLRRVPRRFPSNSPRTRFQG
jgi:hypothetical protein